MKCFLIYGTDIDKLKKVAKRLYSETRMNGNDMRGMAQVIAEGVIPSLEELSFSDQEKLGIAE